MTGKWILWILEKANALVSQPIVLFGTALIAIVAPSFMLIKEVASVASTYGEIVSKVEGIESQITKLATTTGKGISDLRDDINRQLDRREININRQLDRHEGDIRELRDRIYLRIDMMDRTLSTMTRSVLPQTHTAPAATTQRGPEPGNLGQLVPKMSDDDLATREAARREMVSSYGERAVPALVDVLLSPKSSKIARISVLETLRRIKSLNAAPAILELLDSESDPDVRGMCSLALAGIGPSVVKVLVEAAMNDRLKWTTLANVASALGEIGVWTKPVESALNRLTKHSHPTVVMNAQIAMRQLKL